LLQYVQVFGRLLLARVDGFVMQASENLHRTGAAVLPINQRAGTGSQAALGCTESSDGTTPYFPALYARRLWVPLLRIARILDAEFVMRASFEVRIAQKLVGSGKHARAQKN
jgi:hypothetical protein